MKKFFTLIAAAMVSTTLFAEDLTTDMFHSWTAADATAEVAGTAGCAYEVGVSTGMPYGDGNVYYLNFADLSKYATITVVATEGEPRLLFNRIEDNGTVNVECPRDAATYETVVDNGDGSKTYTVDIAKIVENYGFAHLHAIKGANWANTTVTSMTLEKASSAEGVVLTLTNNGAEAGSEVEKLSYQFVAACAEGYELDYTAKPVLYYGENTVEGSVMPIDATSFAVRFMQQQEYAEAGEYEVVVPENTVTVNGEGNAEYKGVWTVKGSNQIVLENVEVGTVVDDSWGSNDTYYTATFKFAKPAGAVYAYSEGLHMELNGENTGVPFTFGQYGMIELGEGDEVTLVYKDNMIAATDDAEYEGDIRPAGSYVATTEIAFLDADQMELPVTATYTGSVVLPSLVKVALGTPVFNVDQDPFNGSITVGEVEANGIVMTLDGAENITPEMTIKVVADLQTAIPNFGQGQDGEDGGFNAPQFETVIENAEFVGDAMFGVPAVAMTEFAQYVVEAGAGAYMVIVKSIDVIGAAGVEASWALDEEVEPVGTLFQVVDDPVVANGDYVIYNPASGLYLNGSNYWGTKASATKHGQFMTFEMQQDGTYTIDSHLSNGGGNHFVNQGEDLYIDGGAVNHVVELTQDGLFTIMDPNGKYLAVEEGIGLNDRLVNFSAVEVTEAAQWQLISRDALYNSVVGSVDPVDVTALLGDANFGRNNTDFDLWQGDKPGKGGYVENMNAEKWGGNTQLFNSYQTIELPNGIYSISAQGFYRYNNTPDNTNDVAAAAHADGTEEIYAFFYANNDSVAFPSIADEATVAANDGAMPFSQDQASAAFGKGLYYIEPMIVEVTDGTLTVGVKKVNHIGTDWTLWDNFEIYYLGELTPDAYLGAPVFNVDEDPFYGMIALGDLEANGLKATFPEAVGITPDMQIKMVATLSTLAPGYGAGDGEDVDPGFSAPEFHAVIENAEFVGDAMFGAPVVYFTEFAQYIYEAGAGAFMIEVSSIEVLNGAGEAVCTWTPNAEEGDICGTVFEVTEAFVTENVTAVVGQTEANEWGDQHYTVALTVPADEIAGLGVAYAFTEGVRFAGNAVEETEITLWENDGTYGTIQWDGTYRFGVEGSWTAECIATFDAATWESLKTQPVRIYIEKDASAEYTNVRLTNGWWSVTYGGDEYDLFQLAKEDENGNLFIDFDLSTDEAFVAEIDEKNILFTGNGYKLVKICQVATVETGVVEFTFNADALEGVEVAEDQDIVMNCTDAMVSQTTDTEYDGEIRAEGTYAASAVIVLVDANGKELGYAEFRGELTLSKDITGIQNVTFNVTDVIYNLNGQKVSKAEGLVIKNGKVILVK